MAAGASMGGFGTYECITREPETFAAAMPLCGGGDETQVSRFVKVPIWIFHGAKDAAVKVEASRIMFKALKDAGGNPRYTEFAERPHGMGEVNTTPEALEWMFAQRRQSSK